MIFHDRFLDENIVRMQDGNSEKNQEKYPVTNQIQYVKRNVFQIVSTCIVCHR